MRKSGCLCVFALVLGGFLLASFLMDMGHQDEVRLAGEWMAAVQRAEDSYHSRFGKYTGSLGELGSRGARLLDDHFNRNTFMGVVLTLTGSETGYSIQVYPETWFVEGHRSLYTDETHKVIVSDWPWKASK
jgi:hypothetical protein